MKIKVIVKPNSRTNEVVQSENGTLTVRVNAPPVEGKANDKVVELLSNYFKKPKRCISIIAGFKGKTKIVEIQ